MDRYLMLPTLRFVALLALTVNTMTDGSNTTNTSTIQRDTTTMTLNKMTTMNKATTKACKQEMVVVLFAGGTAILSLLLFCMVLACCVCSLQRRLRSRCIPNNTGTSNEDEAHQSSEARNLNVDHQAKAGESESVVLLEMNMKSNEVEDGPGEEQVLVEEQVGQQAQEDNTGTAINAAEDGEKENTQPSTENCFADLPEQSATEDCQDVSGVPLMV